MAYYVHRGKGHHFESLDFRIFQSLKKEVDVVWKLGNSFQLSAPFRAKSIILYGCIFSIHKTVVSPELNLAHFLHGDRKKITKGKRKLFF